MLALKGEGWKDGTVGSVSLVEPLWLPGFVSFAFSLLGMDK